jgi:hypothetical protein
MRRVSDAGRSRTGPPAPVSLGRRLPTEEIAGRSGGAAGPYASAVSLAAAAAGRLMGRSVIPSHR